MLRSRHPRLGELESQFSPLCRLPLHSHSPRPFQPSCCQGRWALSVSSKVRSSAPASSLAHSAFSLYLFCHSPPPTAPHSPLVTTAFNGQSFCLPVPLSLLLPAILEPGGWSCPPIPPASTADFHLPPMPLWFLAYLLPARHCFSPFPVLPHSCLHV